MHRLVAVCALAVAISVQVTITSAQDSPADAKARRDRILLGFFDSPTGTLLAKLSPITGASLETPIRLGEYRGTAAVSPDRSRLALSSGGPRGGILIYSLPELELIHRVHPGIAAEALAWLSPTRLAAALQCNPSNPGGRGCGVVLVDPVLGRIVRRWPDTDDDVDTLPFTPPIGLFPKPVAVTPDGVVFLLAHHSSLAPARVVLVTRDAKLRSASLLRIRLGVGPGRRVYWGQSSGGIALDPPGERAYVVGMGRALAEVDLSTMDVRYREIEALETSPDGGRRAVIRLDRGHLAVFGDHTGGDGRPVDGKPVGVTVIDTNTWDAWTVDDAASRAAFTAGTLLVYGGDAAGLTGYALDGRRLFHLFDDGKRRSITSVHVDGTQAYVVLRSGDATSTLAVVDALTGTVAHTSALPGQLVDLMATAGP